MNTKRTREYIKVKHTIETCETGEQVETADALLHNFGLQQTRGRLPKEEYEDLKTILQNKKQALIKAGKDIRGPKWQKEFNRLDYGQL